MGNVNAINLKQQEDVCINDLLLTRENLLSSEKITKKDIDNIVLILHEAADLLKIKRRNP